MASTPGFEPGPHWWEASALTTAPSDPLLPTGGEIEEGVIGGAPFEISIILHKLRKPNSIIVLAGYDELSMCF